MRTLSSWVQSKFSGRQEKKKLIAGSSSTSRAPTPVVHEKELSNWPQALLAIGTFGNKDVNEDSQKHIDPSENLDKDLLHFTIEVSKLQKELAKLFSRELKSITDASEVAKEDNANLSLNRFLNCPSNLEVDRSASVKLENLENDNHGDLSPNTKIVLNNVKNASSGNHNVISKKSLSFLFKMFVCGGGHAPTHSLRDPTTRFDQTLRAILTKKIYPQSSAATLMKKYLENNVPNEKMQAGKEEDIRKDQHRWIKTDSEYIVLEI